MSLKHYTIDLDIWYIDIEEDAVEAIKQGLRDNAKDEFYDASMAPITPEEVVIGDVVRGLLGAFDDDDNDFDAGSWVAGARVKLREEAGDTSERETNPKLYGEMVAEAVETALYGVDFESRLPNYTITKKSYLKGTYYDEYSNARYSLNTHES